jgi:hypothetical protein
VHSRLESAQFAFSNKNERPAVYSSEIPKKQGSDSDLLSDAETIRHGLEVTNEPEDSKWNVVNSHKKQTFSLQGTQVLLSTVNKCSSDMPGGGDWPCTIVPERLYVDVVRGLRVACRARKGGPCLKETVWIFWCYVLTTEYLLKWLN